MICPYESKRFLWIFGDNAICVFVIPYLRIFITIVFSPDFYGACIQDVLEAEKESHNGGSQGISYSLFLGKREYIHGFQGIIGNSFQQFHFFFGTFLCLSFCSFP